MGIVTIVSLFVFGTAVLSGGTALALHRIDKKEEEKQLEFMKATVQAHLELEKTRTMLEEQLEKERQARAETKELAAELMDILGNDEKPKLKIVK